MQLYPYQEAAISALWNYIQKKDGNPVLVLPTGAGKTHMLAQIAKDVVHWGGRMICLTHVRELISQLAEHLRNLAPEITFGIYSAGLKSKEIGYQVTLAGIQSAADEAELFGPADIICIDEAHRVPQDGEGQYQTFLQSEKTINPKVRVIGLTATPYRLSSGPICQPGGLFNEVCFEIGIKELIRDGYLSPIFSKVGKEKYDLSGVHIRGGEFIESELQEAMKEEDKLVRACLEIAEKCQERKSVIVFATGVGHANATAQMLCDIEGPSKVGVVLGDTSPDLRDKLVSDFKERKIKYLVNCQVLTTGFDSRSIDCVAILRPTMSPGLLVQMAGRGFRKADGKKDCVILDFGGNFLRHGPIDMLREPDAKAEREISEFKECPDCQEAVPHGCQVCPCCGHVWEKKARGNPSHDGKAYEGDILSREEYPVESIAYWKHRKKNAGPDHPPTLWVQYTCGLAQASEWICFEHQGFARQKAEKWWRARSKEPCPNRIEDAITLWDDGKVKEPKRITIAAEGKYMRVLYALDFVEVPPHPRNLEKKPDEIFKKQDEKITGFAQEDIPF